MMLPRKAPVYSMVVSRLCALALLSAVPVLHAATSTPLKLGWTVQSDCKIHGDGASLSLPGADTKGWYTATIPSTVLAVQVAAGEFKEPYVGMNLRNIPGTSYPVGENFSNIDMAADSPYRCGWWYRKSFEVPATGANKTSWLHFAGINYKADVWLNGIKIAGSDEVQGAYRTYDFNVSKALKPGHENVLAVETFAPTPTDLGINWVDWNPCPPDKDMGLWGAVSLRTSGPVVVRSPLVTTHFPDASLKSAELTVHAQVTNATDHAISGKLEGTVAGIAISQPVTLDPSQSKSVTFPNLTIASPHVWWPADVGAHPLENATLRFVIDGQLSDEKSIRFGIREVVSELTTKGALLFKINQRPILIRGAGWSPDMMLRDDNEKLAAEFTLVHDMHLNTIRLEGKLETEEFFNLADEQGVMVMAGWCCCDHWEHWDKWDANTLKVATASLDAQIMRIRSHSSLIAWFNGSDNPPPANVETAYLNVLKQDAWPNAIVSSATGQKTAVTGESGVKMTGPYDYVAPSYWLTDTRYGGAYGFNTETSPGPAIPSLTSIAKMLPPDHRWPQDAVWNYHAGSEGFKDIRVFNDAMTATYGSATTPERYNLIAQSMAFDGERAMFEAYGRNKYTKTTGVVQWMLSNAWPSSIWHLYDYYLDAAGGFYGARKANELLHIQYSYDDHSIWVVNSLYEAAPQLTATARVYDLGLKELFTKSNTLDAASDSSTKTIDIPQDVFANTSGTYLVILELKDAKGKIVSTNSYWVPGKLTEFDFAKTNYTHTPAKTPEDMTALASLPPTNVTATAQNTGSSIHVRLSNPSKKLAFQLSVELEDEHGNKLPRITWNDNYIELLPGHAHDLTAQLPAETLKALGIKDASTLKVKLEGWNVAPITISPLATVNKTKDSGTGE
ncbi:exo-1,4-beta-D-glucosaminidase [Granulicella aggregans]|uniref:Exo-1,4-beta-D-glucosaminidase n=1 Tax=Granulicella aggregans TaxID=474949 RepID=A0A7W7ZFV4_9BACT|nr:glycosyl hydrolase family 2 [Granulicella aggregans]MBB5059155.1 exo-1,4-beta-D-glucosaminidase [Granulicella aggregans]